METETERDRMHALALRTVESIEQRAEAIALLRGHEGTWWGDTEQDEREPIRAARERLELDPFVPNEDAATDVADGLDEEVERIGNEEPLSMQAEGVYDWTDGWQVTAVVIVLGTGGPHVEVRYAFDRAHVIAFGWFGADRVELPVDVDAVDALYSPSTLAESIEDNA